MVYRTSFSVGDYRVVAEGGPSLQEHSLAEKGSDYVLKHTFIQTARALAGTKPMELARFLDMSPSIFYLDSYGLDIGKMWYYERSKDNLERVEDKLDMVIDEGLKGAILNVCNPCRRKLRKLVIPVIYPITTVDENTFCKSVILHSPKRNKLVESDALEIVDSWLTNLLDFDLSRRENGSKPLIRQMFADSYEIRKKSARRILLGR